MTTVQDNNIGKIISVAQSTFFGVGIPFLAKAQLFGGLGVNQHSVTPDYSIQFIESTFSNMDIEEAANQDFSNDAVFDQSGRSQNLMVTDKSYYGIS